LRRPDSFKTREESFSPIALKLRETSLCRKRKDGQTNMARSTRDGQTDMARSTRLHADHEYIHFMGSETSLSLFHKLLTEIIILSARYKNVISKLRRLYV